MTWRAAVLDWLFPPRCAACGAPQARGFCGPCEGQIGPARPGGCRLCAQSDEVGEDAICRDCRLSPPEFDGASSCAVYRGGGDKGPLERVLHRYKYERDLAVAPVLAELLQRRNPLPLARFDLVVPVPLHLDRLRWRGFNQAQVLAELLVRRDRAPKVDPLVLARVRRTAPQVGLDGERRRRNVAGAFAVEHRDRLRGKRVLLVDDVYTSGATSRECSKVLRRAGARSVEVLVLARTQ